MKIHVVQKGDTLWELSKQYGVDFEELKQVNSHLASPDMIMPGMKIKIPSTAKAVKKETQAQKEIKKPYKDVSPKPMPVIHEDDKEKKKIVKPEMPVQPPKMPTQQIMQMPIIDQDFDFEFNFPQMPSYPKPKAKEEPKKEKVKKEVKEPVKKQPSHKPYPPKQPMYQPPVHAPVHQPMIQPMPPMMPCCFYVHPCHPPMPHPMMMPDTFMPPAPQQPALPAQLAVDDCGCGGTSSQAPAMTAPADYYPTQNFSSYQPMLNTDPFMGAQMYPTPYPAANTDSAFDYPTPPSYPNFSALQRDEDGEEKNEDENK
ncbi:SafA/ExsA family spore coat assembly protein [Oceanobacillus salinisoli]|uniref:SafA/ExsA family spore coat assembly protein n=1 Tax=Oceanobacillus salinisoli TaxID=2678611 RepID=UPI0012E2ED89|nr:SafA/ExsA family spore coat assembly protein [Oceanobacillus salinisoli]